MSIGQNLPIGGKNEARAKSPTKFRKIKGAKTLIVSFYINPHYRRPNSFGSGDHCMRIGIQSRSIFLVCTHHLLLTFLMEPTQSYVRARQRLNEVDMYSITLTQKAPL